MTTDIDVQPSVVSKRKCVNQSQQNKINDFLIIKTRNETLNL